MHDSRAQLRWNGYRWWPVENNLVKQSQSHCSSVGIVFWFHGASTKDLTQNIKTRAIFKKQSPFSPLED